MKDIPWTQIMRREFRTLACLSEDELAVLLDWSVDKSITETAMKYSMCETKVKDIRKVLREKYDAVEIYTPLLPKRVK